MGVLGGRKRMYCYWYLGWGAEVEGAVVGVKTTQESPRVSPTFDEPAAVAVERDY